MKKVDIQSIQVSTYPKKTDIHVSKYPHIHVSMISKYPIIQLSKKSQYPRYPSTAGPRDTRIWVPEKKRAAQNRAS